MLGAGCENCRQVLGMNFPVTCRCVIHTCRVQSAVTSEGSRRWALSRRQWHGIHCAAPCGFIGFVTGRSRDREDRKWERARLVLSVHREGSCLWLMGMKENLLARSVDIPFPLWSSSSSVLLLLLKINIVFCWFLPRLAFSSIGNTILTGGNRKKRMEGCRPVAWDYVSMALSGEVELGIDFLAHLVGQQLKLSSAFSLPTLSSLPSHAASLSLSVFPFFLCIRHLFTRLVV